MPRRQAEAEHSEQYSPFLKYPDKQSSQLGLEFDHLPLEEHVRITSPAGEKPGSHCKMQLCPEDALQGIAAPFSKDRAGQSSSAIDIERVTLNVLCHAGSSDKGVNHIIPLWRPSTILSSTAATVICLGTFQLNDALKISRAPERTVSWLSL
jgi:hypothetical protein